MGRHSAPQSAAPAASADVRPDEFGLADTEKLPAFFDAAPPVAAAPPVSASPAPGAHASDRTAKPTGSRHAAPRHRRAAVPQSSGRPSAFRPTKSRTIATNHAAQRPLWRRSPAIPAAVMVFAVWTGADSTHLLGTSHAAAAGKADVRVDLSAIAAGSAEGPTGSGAVSSGTVNSDTLNAAALDAQARVSRKSRVLSTSPVASAATTVLPARPSLPVLNPDKTVAGTWLRPSAGPETSCFCMRWGAMHEGIDLAGPMNSPIVATGDGVVLEAGPASGFGLWVVIQQTNGDVTVYGHMYHYFVKAGQHVTAGEHIADIGANGESTGPHLHFGVRLGGPNGPYIDPIPWLKARGITVGPYSPNA